MCIFPMTNIIKHLSLLINNMLNNLGIKKNIQYVNYNVIMCNTKVGI